MGAGVVAPSPLGGAKLPSHTPEPGAAPLPSLHLPAAASLGAIGSGAVGGANRSRGSSFAGSGGGGGSGGAVASSGPRGLAESQRDSLVSLGGGSSLVANAGALPSTPLGNWDDEDDDVALAVADGLGLADGGAESAPLSTAPPSPTMLPDARDCEIATLRAQLAAVMTALSEYGAHVAAQASTAVEAATKEAVSARDAMRAALEERNAEVRRLTAYVGTLEASLGGGLGSRGGGHASTGGLPALSSGGGFLPLLPPGVASAPRLPSLLSGSLGGGAGAPSAGDTGSGLLLPCGVCGALCPRSRLRAPPTGASPMASRLRQLQGQQQLAQAQAASLAQQRLQQQLSSGGGGYSGARPGVKPALSGADDTRGAALLCDGCWEEDAQLRSVTGHLEL
jgi:hypothetical protein